ncbi:adenylate/guanylate cyclase domain-containing protein [Thalassotalea sp. SU-HH00458]|uniref:CHASE2 domain-containing protein n=1 Tax=Thalassotalea sp. SU-HH00458 TaxID=3127657 RepID=UPI003101F371
MPQIKLYSTLTKHHFLAVATLIFCLTVSLQFFSPAIIAQVVNRLDGLVYDLKIKLLAPQTTNLTNIQIVDIDEESIAHFGRMPWSREKFAKLTQTLTEQGAIVIVYDILFSESQDSPVKDITRVLPQLSQNEQMLLNDYFDYDGAFALSMANNDIVLANLFHYHNKIKVGGFVKKSRVMNDASQNRFADQSISQKSIDADNMAKRSHLVKSTSSSENSNTLQENFVTFTGYTNPITRFSKVAAGQGFMNAITDFDGVVRRTPLVIEYEQHLFPSLALEAFRVYSLVDQINIEWEQSNNAYFEGVTIGNVTIPTDDSAQILIPYRGQKNHYTYTSAADLIQGKVTDNRFEQAVVFVGTSAIGLADLQTTPVSVNYPGVEIHATVFDALMSPNNIPYRPDWWKGAIFIQLMIISLLCLLVFPHKDALFSVVFTVLIIISVITVNLSLWRIYRIDLPIVVLLLQTLIFATYFIGYGFFSESNRRKVIKSMFAQYVPGAHIDKLLSDSTAINLEGERKTLSVMFCDIRNFTSISESMPANELKDWLNSVFSPLTNEILRKDGTIDKYVGDMIMAFWGAPITDELHSQKSIHAGLEMLSNLTKLNEEFIQQGKPSVSIGIGINTGEMNVGDMGSDFRRSYTVIGDAVNLASRLEGLTKFYGVELLVSEFTQQQAPDFNYLLVDKVKVVGKSTPIFIYTVLKDEQQVTSDDFKCFSLAQKYYFNQQFELSEQAFNQINPDFNFSPLVSIYLKRIEAYKCEPPNEHWDGSYQHIKK